MRMARPQEPSFCCRVFLSKSFQRERKLFNPFLAPLSICCSIWMEFPRGASAGHRHQSEFELSITSIVSPKVCNLPGSPEYENQILTFPFRGRMHRINQINHVNSSAEIYRWVLRLEAHISKLAFNPQLNSQNFTNYYFCTTLM